MDHRFDKLTQIDLIYYHLNIYIYKRCHIEFFSVKPNFFTNILCCLLTHQVDWVILSQPRII